MNFSRFINAVSSARKISPIRETTSILLKNPHFISLAGGMPNPSMFPFEKAQVTVSDGHVITLEGRDMERSLQYSASRGLPEMIDWIENLMKKYHNPPLMQNAHGSNFHTIVTNGSQDGLIKVFEMLVSPGDNLLVEDPCYPGVLAQIQPMPCNLIPVKTDAQGMIPESLTEIMKQWSPEDAENPESNIPKVLYTVPTGGNPTGATCSLQRKQKIYEIAQKYNLVIVEDDPYYFLQFGEPTPTYLSMDVDGRVIRSDSLSKVVSSGLRLGWISGAEAFIQRLILHHQASCLHTSSLVQMLVFRLVEHWGDDGFEKHVISVSDFYKDRRDFMESCLSKYLGDFAEWHVPEAGMFFWIKLKDVKDTSEFIQNKAREEEVLLLPGKAFQVSAGETSSFCRAAYSIASKEEIEEAFVRLRRLLDNNSK